MTATVKYPHSVTARLESGLPTNNLVRDGADVLETFVPCPSRAVCPRARRQLFFFSFFLVCINISSCHPYHSFKYHLS